MPILGKSMNFRAAVAPLPEIPFDLHDPLYSDGVRPSPSYFIVPARDAVNSNAPKMRSRGDPQTGKIRVVSLFGSIGRLIDAYVKSRWPDWESSYTNDPESLYDQICATGADLIFLHARYEELLQRLKLDPSFCDVPVVLIDSWDMRHTEASRERWIRSGATAVLFVPVLDQGLFALIEELLPGSASDSPSPK
jgi:hypothetical protein